MAPQNHPLYSIATWDTELQSYTPQIDVPAFNLNRGELIQSMRLLQDLGYSVHRNGNCVDGHGDNDTYVLIERTDGKPEHEILQGWER